MLLVGVIVMLDVGYPPIFWQQRPGARGRPIRILKFRTMGPARDRNRQALTDLQRVSRFGLFLRRLRLDELPQVYNVLLGHMSLVGPRPLLPIDQPESSTARLSLRPGLTGWAQIKGGRHLSIADKAALDLWYIENASFALDMRILANTVRMVLSVSALTAKPSTKRGMLSAAVHREHLAPTKPPKSSRRELSWSHAVEEVGK
jgi:lipopolysaccharide/colanic/teichoic acid biosynthesis glycosyltransferase